MLHKNKDNFTRTLNQVAMQTGFLLPLVEKDYYLTLMLSRLHELSPDLVFKGGTCLNKVYFSYYRLSEDLDFSMRLPRYTVTRGTRRKCIQVVKENVKAFAEQFDMRIDDTEKPGRNESRQYIYCFVYHSAEPEVLKLFQKKLKEDGAGTDLARYSVNLGRGDKEIKDMRKRIKEELFEVLTPGERKNFNLDTALERINNALSDEMRER